MVQLVSVLNAAPRDLMNVLVAGGEEEAAKRKRLGLGTQELGMTVRPAASLKSIEEREQWPK